LDRRRPCSNIYAAILERGKPVLLTGYSGGLYQYLLYWVMAGSAKIFGLNEFALRFPLLISGVLTIPVTYLLGKELFNKKTGILSAILVAFLNIEILYSRQARPYQAVQLFYLCEAYFAYRLSFATRINYRDLAGFLFSGLCASLFHGLGMVVLFDGFLFLIIVSFQKLKKFLISILFFLILMLLFFSQYSQMIFYFGQHFNFFYYRVFLIHNYLPLVIFSFIGGLFLFLQREWKKLLLLTIFLGGETFVVAFILPQPFVRYFYIVFAFFLLLASHGIFEIGDFFGRIIEKRLKIKFTTLIISLVLILSVISFFYRTNKISIIPQKIYSLNADMQEIPEVDWKKIYGFIGKELEMDKKIVLVTNWNDLPIWYFGEDFNNRFVMIRKGNYNPNIDFAYGEKVIYSLDQLKSLMKENKKGLIVLDSWDDQVADGVREYAQNNLKKEFEIDRLYPVQPRYWPVNVYSWGL